MLSAKYSLQRSSIFDYSLNMRHVTHLVQSCKPITDPPLFYISVFPRIFFFNNRRVALLPDELQTTTINHLEILQKRTRNLYRIHRTIKGWIKGGGVAQWLVVGVVVRTVWAEAQRQPPKFAERTNLPDQSNGSTHSLFDIESETDF